MQFNKCLLIEDHGPLRNMIIQCIHVALGNDVKVVEAWTVARAKNELVAHPDIDIIIVDSHMEFNSTHHLVWNIRKEFKGIIIGVTNTVIFEGEREEMMNAGCLHVCVKGDELLKYLEHLAKEV